MDTRGEWEWLAGIYFPVMVAVTVVVVAAFVYPVMRYRRRREPPTQHSEASRLEFGFAVLLLCRSPPSLRLSRSPAMVALPSRSRRRLRRRRLCRRRADNVLRIVLAAAALAGAFMSPRDRVDARGRTTSERSGAGEVRAATTTP